MENTMDRKQEVYLVLGLIVGALACIATWLAVPLIQPFLATLYVVRTVEDEVMGGLTACGLPMYYSNRSEIFLYDLAVKPEYQRMGFGKGLIQSLKEYCIKNGIKEFFVMAHEEDEHAIEFYRATGGRGEKVINFVY
jgi:aminoglycoside 3-N-acetyltransferase I